jgi:uncharacterized protein
VREAWGDHERGGYLDWMSGTNRVDTVKFEALVCPSMTRAMFRGRGDRASPLPVDKGDLPMDTSSGNHAAMSPLSPLELERLRPVLDRIVAQLKPEEIWLFGSRVEQRARQDSDYDLLAVVPDGTPEADLDPVRAWSLVRGLGVPVDIVPCTRSEFEEEKHEIDTLPRAAFLRGIRIYERGA